MEVTEVEIPQDQEEENLVVDADAVEEVDSHQARSILTRLLATGVGCVAIWPVTVPRPVMHSHREVAMPFPRKIHTIQAKRPTERKRPW